MVDAVGATGTLEAMTTVQVGSQVSGTILSLHADFNSEVRSGQVIARLDPSLFEARLGQARANLVAARANVERQQAAEEDAQRKLVRARELSGQQLLPASDLETAQANAEAARAQLKALQAAVTQAEANVQQADVDLAHTVITRADRRCRDRAQRRRGPDRRGVVPGAGAVRDRQRPHAACA